MFQEQKLPDIGGGTLIGMSPQSKYWGGTRPPCPIGIDATANNIFHMLEQFGRRFNAAPERLSSVTEQCHQFVSRHLLGVEFDVLTRGEQRRLERVTSCPRDPQPSPAQLSPPPRRSPTAQPPCSPESTLDGTATRLLLHLGHSQPRKRHLSRIGFVTLSWCCAE